ncbi:MAG: YwqG family protein, partial [Spirosomaceae bacterium]|nr:YwqG family protein [Spirosomataceae bacterium]
LPRKGMLFFFLQTIHSIYGSNHNAGKVIYCEDISTLSSGKRFQFTTDDYSEMYDAAYYASKVEAFKMNSVPSFYAAHVNKHLFLGEAEKLKDNERFLQDLYDTFERPMEENNSRHYAVNNRGFTQHEAPELQASLEKKGNPQDWMTLLSLNSVEDMQWGDAGELFFVIHKSDLAKCDFSNVFVTMESS